MRNGLSVAISKSGVPIRLSDERWSHGVEGHLELADRRTDVLQTISAPTRVVAGGNDELLALRPQEDGKVLVAIYRELADDGFVITASLTRRLASLQRRTQLWPSPESTNF